MTYPNRSQVFVGTYTHCKEIQWREYWICVYFVDDIYVGQDCCIEDGDTLIAIRMPDYLMEPTRLWAKSGYHRSMSLYDFLEQTT